MVDGDLAGEQGSAAGVAVAKDREEVVSSLSREKARPQSSMTRLVGRVRGVSGATGSGLAMETPVYIMSCGVYLAEVSATSAFPRRSAGRRRPLVPTSAPPVD